MIDRFKNKENERIARENETIELFNRTIKFFKENKRDD
jgi:hypothetical protein